MSKQKVLGIDLGSNSIGWALLNEIDGKPSGIIDIGCRIFTKAVEEKTPTPKNAKRRHARLLRRVLQRRARRKQRLQNYLLKLNLLPETLRDNPSPEQILNALGDPYQLRKLALDQALQPYQLGRVLLHLAQRRGFLSSRKTLLGDLVNDPDTIDLSTDLDDEEGDGSERAKEETAFKQDIALLKHAIEDNNCRTLGEYLAGLNPRQQNQRNRLHAGGHLRTDRQMYFDELEQIFAKQQSHHPQLSQEVQEEIQQIIFFQRPLKLRADRVGRCSLEPKNNRARLARLQSQQFRYLQDINNLKFFERHSELWLSLKESDRITLQQFFENHAEVSITGIRKRLGFDKHTEFNLERGNKKLKGNTTACKIRGVLSDWDQYSEDRQHALVEDFLTIQKKSVLKNRLIQHWRFDATTAVKLCLLEFEPGHASLSSKAINRLLPYLKQGLIYSEARKQISEYDYEPEKIAAVNRLGPPPETANPIVNKGLHELKRVINALIAEHGKPDVIRIELARDLEMNTKRYTEFTKQQKANSKANDEAQEKFHEQRKLSPHLGLRETASKSDRLKYRLWKDQDGLCAYSTRPISLSVLFSPEIEIDHILPYSESLDDSYLNKVVCFVEENRFKGQRTPIDAFGKSEQRWNQITQAITKWAKKDRRLAGKKNKFFMTAADVQKRDFLSSQLNDTRYIGKLALEYLQTLGVEITASKGATTAWVRHQWHLNSLLSDSGEKERTDHRHHALDAAVIACVNRRFYNDLVKTAKQLEQQKSQLEMRDLVIDPPWPNLRTDLQTALDQIIVAHTPQRKLNGELHDLTGAGFIEGIGNVYRKTLDESFAEKNKKGIFTKVEKIIDPTIKKLVLRHLAKHADNLKSAFNPENVIYHKNGETPICRVRVVQSDTSLKELGYTKHGAKDKAGKVFKWLPYNNIHHVEILKINSSGKVYGTLVTMMEASHRAKGIASDKQAIIQTNHGDGIEFIMALHKQDMVKLSIDSNVQYYQVTKLGQLDQGNQPRLELVPHTSAKDKAGAISDSVQNLITKYLMQSIQVNAIGKILND